MRSDSYNYKEVSGYINYVSLAPWKLGLLATQTYHWLAYLSSRLIGVFPTVFISNAFVTVGSLLTGI